jgi:hypothetical protein
LSETVAEKTAVTTPSHCPPTRASTAVAKTVASLRHSLSEAQLNDWAQRGVAFVSSAAAKKEPLWLTDFVTRKVGKKGLRGLDVVPKSGMHAPGLKRPRGGGAFTPSLGGLVLALCACATPANQTPESDECAAYFEAISTCFGPEVAARVRTAWTRPSTDASSRERARTACIDESKRLRESCR